MNTEIIVGAGQPELTGEAPPARQSSLAAGEFFWWPESGTLFSDARYDGLGGGVPGSYSAVWACTRAIAETLSSLPGQLFEQVDEFTKRPSSDPIGEVLQHPNDDMDYMSFYDLVTCRLVNAGNGFAEMERNERNQITALWPIDNSRITPWRNSDGELEWHVYHDPNSLVAPSSAGRDVYSVVPKENMLNVVGPNSIDGVIAPGVIPRAGEDIQHGLNVRRYGSQFFGKGGRPDGVLEHPGRLNPDDRRQMRREWNEIHSKAAGGAWYEIGVLWEGMKYHEIGVAPEQAQFLETTKLNGNIIAQWYGVAPAIIQDYSDSKFATVEAQLKHFVMLSMRPWATRWERAFKRQLLGVDSLLFWRFLFDDLLRGDPKTQNEANEVKFRNGAMNADEWRTQSGMNPIGDGSGQTYWINNAYSPVRARAVNAAGEAAAAAEARRVTSLNEELTLAAAARRDDTFAAQILDRDFRRWQHNERQAALRAAKNFAPKFAAWLQEYYIHFSGRMADEIRPAAEQLELDADELAAAYCAESQRLLGCCLDGEWNLHRVIDQLEQFRERSLT